jgi:hypothetical protein
LAVTIYSNKITIMHSSAFVCPLITLYIWLTL